MLKRVTLFSTLNELSDYFEVTHIEANAFEPNFNAGPDSSFPVIYAGHARERTISTAIWRKEVLPEGGDFESLTLSQIDSVKDLQKRFQRKRCILPINGFYEWKALNATIKIPFYFRVLNEPILGIAAIYERSDEGKMWITPICTKSNELTEPLSETMPAILDEEDFGRWLDPLQPNLDGIKNLIHPKETIHMASFRVSLDVNNPDKNSPSLIIPEV